jgi:hypothetical protein
VELAAHRLVLLVLQSPHYLLRLYRVVLEAAVRLSPIQMPLVELLLVLA